jgi:hypothetical protein
MSDYFTAAIAAIIVCTAVMMLIFRRLKLFDLKTAASVAVASLITVITFPALYNIITALDGGNRTGTALLMILAAALLLNILLAFLLSVLAVVILPKLGKAGEAQQDGQPEGASAGNGAPGENYLEQIFNNFSSEIDRESPNNIENGNKIENNFEISVDSSENIDKMGIDNGMQNSNTLSIDECIEEAFRLKAEGKAEESVLYFMYALDKNPAQKLAFWIVLDICVQYKELGNTELAYDILNSYHEAFADIMDGAVKQEIENNLFDLRA